MEVFYYIFFVMLHKSIKVRTKAEDEDVDELDREVHNYLLDLNIQQRFSLFDIPVIV